MAKGFIEFPVVTEQDWHLAYAFQNEKWIPKEETYSFYIPKVQVGSETPSKLAQERLLLGGPL